MADLKIKHISKNLLDWATVQENYGINTSGDLVSQNGRIATVTPINVDNIDNVFVSWVSSDANIRYIYAIFSNGVLVERVANKYANSTVNVSAADSMYICFYSVTNITKNDITNAMINSGTSGQPYEPYSTDVWHDLAPKIYKNGAFADTTNNPQKYSGGAWS